MRDFAALDENNVVVNVIATDDKDIEWCEAFDPSIHKWVFSASENTAKSACIGAVSYTHLTLPTICSV